MRAFREFASRRPLLALTLVATVVVLVGVPLSTLRVHVEFPAAEAQ